MTALVTSDQSRPGHRGQVRAAAVRLVPAAILLCAALAALGWSLAHLDEAAGLQRWDASVDRSFAAHRTSGWNTVTHATTYAAETITVVGIGAVVAVLLRVVLGRWRESLFLAVALLGEVLIFVSVTLVIDRQRPPVPHLDDAPPTSSFPSGHTAAAVTLYAGLAILAWRLARPRWLRLLATALAIAVPVAVGLSRLYRGMHYPTDVLAGALLGAVWLTVAASVVFRRRT